MERVRVRDGILDKVMRGWVLSGPMSEITRGDPQFAVQYPSCSHSGHLQCLALCIIICRAWSYLPSLSLPYHHLESMALFVIHGVWFYLQSAVLLGEAGTVCVLFAVLVTISVAGWYRQNPFLLVPPLADPIATVDVQSPSLSGHRLQGPSLPTSLCVGSITVRTVVSALEVPRMQRQSLCALCSVLASLSVSWFTEPMDICASICRASHCLGHNGRTWHHDDHNHTENPAMISGHHHSPNPDMSIACAPHLHPLTILNPDFWGLRRPNSLPPLPAPPMGLHPASWSLISPWSPGSMG